MAYSKPPASNMPFTFSESGYSKPGSGSIGFNFLTTFQQTANLKAAIGVLNLYQTSTYTYLKECPTIVVGYSGGIPQILNLPCQYGGIRDVGGYIYGNPPHVDLNAYIYAGVNQVDLSAFIRSTIQATKNIGAYTKSFYSSYYDLTAAVKGLITSNKDLGAYTKIVTSTYIDLGARTKVFTNSYIDLLTFLNIIEIRNLLASITGSLFKGQSDLSAVVHKIFRHGYADLFAHITSPLKAIDFPASINSISFFDLSSAVKSILTEYKNLSAYIKAKEIKNLYGILHGWDTHNLSAILTGVYGPYDIQAYINGVGGFKNLVSNIKGMLGTGIFVDLPANLRGSHTNDLLGYVNSILPVDLVAYLTARGKSIDLPAYIVPKTIYLSKVLQISLLEHKDIAAMVNTGCFGSAYRELYAYITSIEKADLRGIIYGWHMGISDVIRDLACYINTANYYVQDRISINIIPQPSKYTQLKIQFTAYINSPIRIFDTLDVAFGAVRFKNLSSTITGILTSKDLSAIVIPVYDWNYNNLPINVNPKTHEIVIDFNDKWREQWRKFVEIFFYQSGNGPYGYFYVEGADKVYRADRDRHWVIWAKSYNEVTDTMIERRNVRNKYLFRMSDYDTVDEAVRDLIDRVSTYRQTDLGASISALDSPRKDLSGSINPINLSYKSWLKNLAASIIGS